MRHHLNRGLAAGAVLAILVAACSGSASPASPSGAAASATPAATAAPTTAPSAAASATPAGPATTVSLWTHSAGNPGEMAALTKWIDEYNASQSTYKIVVQAFPDASQSYNNTITAAALSKTLPCILDADGPNVPSWAYAGYLQPLDIPDATLSAFLPSTTGKWQGKVYAQGLFDAAVAIFALKSDLAAFNLRVPTTDKPWTGEEFQAVLDAYKGSGKFEYAFNPAMTFTGEWYPYAFSPFLQSFGGDLIDRSTYKTAEGALNGPKAVAWGQWWQKLVKDGYMPGTSETVDQQKVGFLDRKFGIDWDGMWNAQAVIDKFGDDALFLPAPDFGNGPKIGAGSWQWAMSSSCPTPEAGNEFINFLLSPQHVAEIAELTGLIPGRDDARALTTKFKDGQPLSVFYSLSKAQALVRPVTPAYTKISTIFEKATADIANGADVQSTLDKAVDSIDTDLKNNSYYGF